MNSVLLASQATGLAVEPVSSHLVRVFSKAVASSR
jgi:hypothetical protein